MLVFEEQNTNKRALHRENRCAWMRSNFLCQPPALTPSIDRSFGRSDGSSLARALYPGATVASSPDNQGVAHIACLVPAAHAFGGVVVSKRLRGTVHVLFGVHGASDRAAQQVAFS